MQQRPLLLMITTLGLAPTGCPDPVSSSSDTEPESDESTGSPTIPNPDGEASSTPEPGTSADPDTTDGGESEEGPPSEETTTGPDPCEPDISVCCGDAVCLEDPCDGTQTMEESCELGCADGVCLPGSDPDGDGVESMRDNCPDVSNPEQENFDADDLGDVCDDDTDNDSDPNESDCEDFDATIHAEAIEACDAIDNDCDGEIDPQGSQACSDYFVDVDGDTYGDDAIAPTCLCSAIGTMTALQGGDCDDSESSVSPTASETCNGVDDDCDAQLDEPWPMLTTSCDGSDADACQDGAIACTADGTGTECNDAPSTPGATEACNGADDDCDGQVDETWAAQIGAPCDGSDTDSCENGEYVCDATGTGVSCTGDANIVEVCDGQDNDCDGQLDEGCDNDNDNYCDGNMSVGPGGPATCNPNLGEDCNDTSAATNPGAQEICNGVDDDCDGVLNAADPDTLWPSPDDYEFNDTIVSAYELLEYADHADPFGPSDTSFGNPGDVDRFYWDDFSNQVPPFFMICRVSGMSPSMRVNVQIGYRRSGDPAFPYVYLPHLCPNLGSGSTCSMNIVNPTAGPDQYTFYASVSQSSGVDECNADYTLECRMDYVNAW